MLKTPSTSNTRIRGIDQERTWAPPLSGLALIAPERAMQAAKGRKLTRVLANYNASKPQE